MAVKESLTTGGDAVMENTMLSALRTLIAEDKVYGGEEGAVSIRVKRDGAALQWILKLPGDRQILLRITDTGLLSASLRDGKGNLIQELESI